ncbi:uncharacterized protein LOC144141278 [Haemaphysalis longicornis]
MRLIVQISILATFIAVSSGQFDHWGWHRRFYIPEFMRPETRIWFWATSRWHGPLTCIRDNVHNATKAGIAFLRTYINRTQYEQDFYVQQMYGRYYDPITMVVRKTSGLPEDIAVERMIYTNANRNCAVFQVWSLKERGTPWCDLRVHHTAIRRLPAIDCQMAFFRRPCYGRKRQLFTKMCRI